MVAVVRFDEGVYFLLKFVEFVEDVDFRSDAPDFVLDVAEMVVFFVVLCNQVFVVEIFIAFGFLIAFPHAKNININRGKCLQKINVFISGRTDQIGTPQNGVEELKGYEAGRRGGGLIDKVSKVTP